MYSHDLDAMSSNNDRVKLGVRSTFVQVILEPKISLTILVLLVSQCDRALTRSM